MIKRAQDMEVFKLSHSLTLEIYKLTEKFPPEEKFGLSAQMRRAASSVPINLAEGAARLSTREYRQFVGISRASASEVAYLILLCKDLGYLAEGDFTSLKEKYEIASKMLTSLIKSLKS